MNIRKLFTSVALAVLVVFTSTLSSCLGGFRAFNSLLDFNNSISQSRFVNNLVFWVLWIIPVYGLFMFGDLIIFNLIEFWSGSNPLGMEEGESESRLITYEGKNYIMTASKDQLAVATEDGTPISKLVFDRSDNSWNYVKNDMNQKLVTIDDITNGVLKCNFYKGDQPSSVYVSAEELQGPSYWAMR
jgi:hypothetical protein